MLIWAWSLFHSDGEADDPDTLAYTIAGFADRLHAIHAPLTQLGIQFVQIGDGEEATRALQELDDNIQVGVSFAVSKLP